MSTVHRFTSGSGNGDSATRGSQSASLTSGTRRGTHAPSICPSLARSSTYGLSVWIATSSKAPVPSFCRVLLASAEEEDGSAEVHGVSLLRRLGPSERVFLRPP